MEKETKWKGKGDEIYKCSNGKMLIRNDGGASHPQQVNNLVLKIPAYSLLKILEK